MNHETTLGVITHFIIEIGLVIGVILLIRVNMKDFMKDYKEWKYYKNFNKD